MPGGARNDRPFYAAAYSLVNSVEFSGTLAFSIFRRTMPFDRRRLRGLFSPIDSKYYWAIPVALQLEYTRDGQCHLTCVAAKSSTSAAFDMC